MKTLSVSVPSNLDDVKSGAKTAVVFAREFVALMFAGIAYSAATVTMIATTDAEVKAGMKEALRQ